MWISDFTWSTPLRKSCTVLAAVLGFITAFASAWPVMEPFVPAHRAYARDLTEHVGQIAENYANKNAAILRDVQVEQAEGKRDAIASELFKWQVELNKTSDDNIKPMVQEQIRRLNNIQDKLNEQIKTLNKIKQKQ